MSFFLINDIRLNLPMGWVPFQLLYLGPFSNVRCSGVSNFLHSASNGGITDMLGGFFRNLGNGNVSGLSIAGLIAAAFLIFGRFGWLGKIAGAFLGMLLIGNNANVLRASNPDNAPKVQASAIPVEEQSRSGGMKR